MLPVQPPLKYENFGGGITENDIPGVSNQYKVADNLSITNDLKLIQRPGSQILSSTQYVLPDLSGTPTANRVSKLINFDADSDLLAAKHTLIYRGSTYGAFTGTWTSLVGPASGAPFTLNTIDTQIHEDQWHKHIFMTSESGNKPIKIYRDGSSVFQLRTAGLPTFTATITGWADNGLADAITLANDLRSKMITHYGNATASPTLPDTTYAHKTHADLTAAAASVTASTAATTLASLITLLTTLRSNFYTHLLDTFQGSSSFPDYHLATGSAYNDAVYETPILNIMINFVNDIDATIIIPATYTILQVIPFLNDLRDKWNCHTFAITTHYSAYKLPHYAAATAIYTGYGLHKTTVPRVDPVSPNFSSSHANLLIAKNITTVVNYINDLYLAYAGHIGIQNHTQNDTVNVLPSQITSITPANLTDALIVAAHTAQVLWRHTADSTVVFDGRTAATYGKARIVSDALVNPLSSTVFAGTVTTGSAIITAVTPDPTTNLINNALTATVGIEPYVYILPLQNAAGATYTPYLLGDKFYITNLFGAEYSARNFPVPARVTAVSANTITTSIAAVVAVGPLAGNFVFSFSKFHYQKQLISLALSTSNIAAAIIDVGTDFDTITALSALGTFAKSISTALSAHTLSGSSAYTAGTNPSFDDFLLPASGLERTLRTIDTQPDTIALIPTHFPWYQVTKDAVITSSGLLSTSPNAVFYPETPGFLEARFTTAPVGVSNGYQFLYRSDYSVGTIANQDFSTPSSEIKVIQYELTYSGSFAEVGTIFTQIPALANASGDNYAITPLVKEIYKTKSNGTVFYKLDSFLNAVLTYTDLTIDTTLDDNATIYTTGGVVAHDTPPLAKYIHILNNVGYYANITDGTEVLPQQLRQSIASDIDSCPSDFFLDFDYAITGISSIKDNIIVGTSKNIHRVNGIFDELGRGGMTSEIISDTVSIINQESIVKTDLGLFFAGNNGFYYCDGFKTARISPHLESTYLSYAISQNQKDRIIGCHMRNQRKILWTLQTTSGGTSATIIWELDLDQGVSDHMPFTTWSGVTGFTPTALTYFGGQVIRGILNGYIFKHDSTYLADPKLDTAVANANNWTITTLFWDFKTTDMDFGTSALKKYWIWMAPQFRQYTNMSIGLYSDIERGKSVSDLTPIRSRKLADWGDTNVSAPSGFVAAAGNVIDEFRRFKSGTLKSNFLAVGLKNGYVVVTASDTAGVATIVDLGGSVFSATLTVAAKKWPSYVVDYYLRLNSVDYLVTVRTSDTVIRCSYTSAPTFAAGVAWELWGYPKNEQAHIVCFNIRYNLMGDKTKNYAGATSQDGGQNA